MNLTVYPKGNPKQYELSDKNWTAEIWEGGKVRITNGNVIDYPVQYHNGHIVYDRPEDVPKYAKRLVVEAFKLIKKTEVMGS